MRPALVEEGLEGRLVGSGEGGAGAGGRRQGIVDGGEGGAGGTISVAVIAQEEMVRCCTSRRRRCSHDGGESAGGSPWHAGCCRIWLHVVLPHLLAIALRILIGHVVVPLPLIG